MGEYQEHIDTETKRMIYRIYQDVAELRGMRGDIVEIKSHLGRLNGSVAEHAIGLNTLRTQRDGCLDRFAQHERAISAMEKVLWRGVLPGVVTGVLVALGALIALVTDIKLPIL